MRQPGARANTIFADICMAFERDFLLSRVSTPVSLSGTYHSPITQGLEIETFISPYLGTFLP